MSTFYGLRVSMERVVMDLVKHIPFPKSEYAFNGVKIIGKKMDEMQELYNDLVTENESLKIRCDNTYMTPFISMVSRKRGCGKTYNEIAQELDMSTAEFRKKLSEESQLSKHLNDTIITKEIKELYEGL